MILYCFYTCQFPWRSNCTLDDIINFRYNAEILPHDARDLISKIFVPANERFTLNDIKNIILFVMKLFHLIYQNIND